MSLASGRVLSFPVRGTRRREAVMRATESGTGKSVLHFRRTMAKARGRLSYVYQIVVPPDERMTPELLWVIYRASPLLSLYFRIPGGGG